MIEMIYRVSGKKISLLIELSVGILLRNYLLTKNSIKSDLSAVKMR